MSKHDRVYLAGREIVGILEKNAEGVRGMMAEETEDDIESINALLDELTDEQMGKGRMQDVLAHLLDHVIGMIFEFGEGLPEDPALMDSLEEYIHRVQLKFERKASALRSEKLRLVMDNFWSDVEDEEEEDDEPGEGIASVQEREAPAPRPGAPRPKAPKPKEDKPAEKADVEADVEVEEEKQLTENLEESGKKTNE